MSALLDELGYAPRAEDGQLLLRNCPFDRLRDSNCELVCSINHALAEGYLTGLAVDETMTAVLRPCADNCCVVVTDSGRRIWTTADCPTTVPALSRKLAPEQAMPWKVTWNGKRSKDGCKSRPETPKAGTYWAIAQFDDAKAVRLRMVLHR